MGDFEETDATLAPEGVYVCPHRDLKGHDARTCLHCQVAVAQFAAQAKETVAAQRLGDVERPLLSMNDAIRRRKEGFAAALWGDERHAFVRAGMPTQIAAHDGIGKSTLAVRYELTRLGWSGTDELLGMPVVPLDPGECVLYLAMDKPGQLIDAIARGFTSEFPKDQDDRLVIYEGMPPAPLWTSAGLAWLEEKVERHRVRDVVFDLVKDMINTNDPEQVVGYNRIMGRFGSRCNLLSLLHPVKPAGQHIDVLPRLSNIAGQGGVYQGHGSVIFLTKSAEDSTIAKVTQVKASSPGGPVDPFFMIVDREDGTVERVKDVDVNEKTERVLPAWARPLRTWMLEVADASGHVPSSTVRDWLIEHGALADDPKEKVVNALGTLDWFATGGSGRGAWWEVVINGGGS
ncbi:AAA family ATPase [Isoptericola cucumis]|uniref:AAA family ATPase n=1 Tax=Isoptericola cucumis TaxID=1776856 RepID=UPI003209BDCE